MYTCQDGRWQPDMEPQPDEEEPSVTAPAQAPRRERLNTERVLQAAVAFADEAGIGAVSMRRLAQELGVVPMAMTAASRVRRPT